MNQSPACPCCGATAWEEIARRTFTRDGAASPYVALRLRVLFEIWSTDGPELTLRYAACRECGMVIYLPRPSARELDAKYRFLGEHEKAPASPTMRSVDRVRSADLLALVRPALPETGRARILDVGGATGALLHDLVAAGHECSVVDYMPVTIAGVTRVGETMEDLSTPFEADVIVCSHVLEHLAEPRELLRSTAPHLKSGGMLFAEVPVEIWGEPPRQREPVTHVNFFTEGSLACCLALAGFSAVRSWTEAAVCGDGRTKLVARATASRGDAVPQWRLRESAREAMAMATGGRRWRWGRQVRCATRGWLRL